jgi:16S rRNA processing protein RimM
MMNWDAMAVVGRIARTHGLKGHVIVNAETDFPDLRFHPDAEVFVKPRGEVERLTIGSVRFQRDRPIVALRGIDDIGAAERLVGAELRVPVEWLAPLPEGAFYRHDLVGCAVVTDAGDEVGTVKEIEGAGGGNRLVVETPSGDVLVPLAQDICTTIDIPGKRIVIAPPQGLLELNARPARSGRDAGSDADRHRDDLSGDARAGAGSRHRRPRH